VIVQLSLRLFVTETENISMVTALFLAKTENISMVTA
jgi:hypothetical protein